MAVQDMSDPYKGVDDKREDFKKMEDDLELVEDLRVGTKALREKHNKYLPKFAAETDPNYKRRWGGATLYNAFEETINVLVGKAFSKPPELDDDVLVEVREGVDGLPALAEDIDKQGNHIQIFAQDLFKRGLRCGLTHLFVDSTPIPPEAATLAEKKAAGQRPYWVIYDAFQVFSWKYEIKNGTPTLTQVRIMETVEEPGEGEFEVNVVEQIRVLEPGLCRLFRQEEANSPWKLYGEPIPVTGPSGEPLDYIPWVTFYADDKNGFMTASPPLLDLAYQNIKHFQKQSDYDNCLTVACFPIFCISGFNKEDDQMAFGPNTIIKLADSQAKAYYAEHTGAALGSARTDLEDKKGEMAQYGLRMLLPKTGQTPTATAEAITESKSLSQLQVAVLRLKDTIEQALKYTALWLGKKEEEGGSINVNVESIAFGIKDVEMILRAAGVPASPLLDKETAIKELIKRDFLDENTDPKEIIKALENQANSESAIRELAGSFLPPQVGGEKPEVANPKGTPPKVPPKGTPPPKK